MPFCADSGRSQKSRTVTSAFYLPLITNYTLTIKQTNTTTMEQAIITLGDGSKVKQTRGVKHYALLLLVNASKDSSADEIFKPADLKKLLLGGARDWEQLSSGGGMFPFTVSEIETILCTKSEQGKLGISRLMECQTRAMMQAYCLLRDDLHKILNH